jgi:hypothetical protein
MPFKKVKRRYWQGRGFSSSGSSRNGSHGANRLPFETAVYTGCDIA